MEPYEIALLVAVVVGALGYSMWSGRKETAAISQVRENLGGEGNNIDVEGTTVNVRYKMVGATNHKSALTWFTIATPSAPAGTLRRKPVPRMGDGGTKKLIAESVRTGDVEFDDRFLITTDDHPAWLGYLTPDRKQALLELLEGFDRVKIEEGQLVAELSRVERDPAKVEASAKLAGAAAKRLALSR